MPVTTLLSPEEHYAKLPRKRVSVSVLIFHRGRLLIVQPTYEPHSLLPGGAVDALETPRAAAIRECKEELGLDIKIERFLGIDHTLYPEDYRTDCLHVMFLAKNLSEREAGAIQLPKEELKGFDFLAPKEAGAKLGHRIKLRMESGVRAMTNETTYYSENGKEI